jgi:hypothetical protein
MSLIALVLAVAAVAATPPVVPPPLPAPAPVVAAPAPARPAPPPPPAPVTSPLAPAKLGKLMCYSPDQALRTCGAMAAYGFPTDGRILNRAQVVVTPTPYIVMTTLTAVTQRGPAVCGRMEGAAEATFTIDGKPADEATTADLRGQIARAFTAYDGVEVCTTYVPFREGFMANVAIGGAPRPDMNQPVIWVELNDGYVVGQ